MMTPHEWDFVVFVIVLTIIDVMTRRKVRR